MAQERRDTNQGQQKTQRSRACGTARAERPVPDVRAQRLAVKQNGNSANYNVTATATDNVGVAKFALSLNGQVFAASVDTCKAGCTVKLQRAGRYTFLVTASDAAGNTAVDQKDVTR